MGRFPAEDIDFLLNFIQDVDQVNNELPGLIERLRLSPSLEDKNLLSLKSKNLATQAQLFGLQVLSPYFDSILELIDTIEPNSFSASEDVLNHINLIFSSLSSNINDWKNKIKRSGKDTKPDLDFKIEPELVSEAHAICLELAEKKVSGVPDINQEITGRYLKEGTELILKLKDRLSKSAEDEYEIEKIRHIVSMIIGNTDVLMESGFSRYPSSHAVHFIQQFFYEMDAILDICLRQEVSLTPFAVEHFYACLDEIDDLFKKFNEPANDNNKTQKLIAGLRTIRNEFEKEIKNKHKKIAEKEVISDLKKYPGSGTEPEQTFLPIRLDRIEDLGNLAGELVVAKNAFTKLRTMIRESDPGIASKFLKKTEDSFHRIISDLDSVILKMRMQEVRTLFQRFPRMIRDMSQKTGKQIDFQFSGEHTEIDNRILSMVTDPIMHLVRNSFDHGIEPPEEREKKGKQKQGVIRLSAVNRDSRSIIEIFDDGRGLDPEKIIEKAVSKGLISLEASKKLSEKEVMGLIFMPGFTTAEEVSEISGRGVGMDVVMTCVNSMNGKIDIDSRPGEYTRIMISMPLTISVSKGLIVSFENNPYIIPLDDVLKMKAVHYKEIQSSPDNAFTKIDNKIYPILEINSHLGYLSPINAKKEQINLVIVKSETRKAVIAVDNILGIEDIIIKPLPEMGIKFEKLYSGCSILSDGNIILILNINQCMKTGGCSDGDVK